MEKGDVKGLTWLITQAFAALTIGALYSYGMMWGAMSLLASGHGSEAILQLVMSPFGMGLLLWPAAFVLATFTGNSRCRCLLVLLLVVHYLALCAQLSTSHLGSFTTNYELPEMKSVLIAMAVAHILVNVGLWVRILRPGKGVKPEQGVNPQKLKGH
jgi:hypothetical protein